MSTGETGPAAAAGAPPPQEVSLHWLTLRFSRPGPEADFRREHAAASLRLVRVSLALGFLLYAAFGALDPVVVPEAVGVAWAIRYGVVCPYALLLLGLSHTRAFRARMEAAVAALGVLAGAGIALIISMARGSGRDLYYAGLLLVTTYLHTFFRLRFVSATLASLAVAAFYVLAAALGAASRGAVLVNNLVFLLAFNVLGMSASYAIERFARREFLQRRLVAEQAARLAEALSRVKVLTGLLPICAWCKRIRTDAGKWQQVETYVSARTDAEFTHGMCPECFERQAAG